MRTALVLILAAAALPAGFGAAELTGVRAVGGGALAALAIGAILAATPSARPAAAWVGVLLAAFVLSHLVAGALGTWGAVAAAALVTVGAAGLLLV